MPVQPIILLLPTGDPPDPPPPDMPVPCHTCGNCMFSEQSILCVTKTAWTCNGGNPSSVTLVEDWPFVLADGNIVQYKLDAANFANYNCVLKRWQVTSTGSSFDTTGVCLIGYDGQVQLDACIQVFIYHQFNNEVFQVFHGLVTMNNCIPSVPI